MQRSTQLRCLPTAKTQKWTPNGAKPAPRSCHEVCALNMFNIRLETFTDEYQVTQPPPDRYSRTITKGNQFIADKELNRDSSSGPLLQLISVRHRTVKYLRPVSACKKSHNKQYGRWYQREITLNDKAFYGVLRLE